MKEFQQRLLAFLYALHTLVFDIGSISYVVSALNCCMGKVVDKTLENTVLLIYYDNNSELCSDYSNIGGSQIGRVNTKSGI